jgi:hypothetical protein
VKVSVVGGPDGATAAVMPAAAVVRAVAGAIGHRSRDCVSDR